ncbi:MAG: hypothetical protein DVB28_000019 [Verrucomicrobia bacterium]|nr:MAG: hypothetical protein DVB28_000019 [Verrucomicrobiota bacterium]
MKQNFAFFLIAALALSACQTGPSARELSQSRKLMEEQISNEPKGNYFVGRRYYKVDYKMWGYLRKPGEPWLDSRLVVLNEDRTLAPDRKLNAIGSDNGHEYKLFGRFSGQDVYEPASNATYPEFVLQRAELLTKTPGPIFKNRKALDPRERYYPTPY